MVSTMQSVITTIGYPGTSYVPSEAGNVVSMRSRTKPGQQFKLWGGRSGRHYAHTVYALVDCPQLPKCTYRLVKSGDRRDAQVLDTGTLESDAPSLNLAKIRQTAARLGATEVHIHFLATTREDRQQAIEDMAVELTH